MRIAITVSLALLAINMPASELNPKVLSLIGDNARAVLGGNVARYRQSVWNDAFPWVLDQSIAGAAQQQITIAYGQDEVAPLTVMIGSAVASASEIGPQVTSLDSITTLVGDQAATLEAVQRWRKNAGMGELGRKAQRLSESYDSWFLIVKPLESFTPNRVASRSDLAAEFMQKVEEASGGIRVGPFTEVSVEVVLKTSDDAVTLAGLGRWLPGFIQLKEPTALPSRIIDLAENLSIRAEGRLVRISL